MYVNSTGVVHLNRCAALNVLTRYVLKHLKLPTFIQAQR